MHGSHFSSAFLPKTKEEARWLRCAARAYGVQPSYLDVDGQVVWANQESVVTVLSALAESEIHSLADLKNLVGRRRRVLEERGIEPTTVVWRGERAFVRLYWPEKDFSGPAEVLITDEFGKKKIYQKKLRSFSARIPLPARLPLGYLRFHLKNGPRQLSTLLIVAPNKLQGERKLARSWGPFLPLYALRSKQDWGIGSFAELKQAALVTKKFGARWVGSLPLLAGNFTKLDCDPSPYNALTRLFWNEIYLDLHDLVARQKSKRAKELIESAEFQEEIFELREQDLVDYFRVFHLKWRVLRILSGEFYAAGGDKKKEFRRFLERNPDAEDYAKFRSADHEERRCHLYAQFQTMAQLERLGKLPGCALYLDYPVGVNESGFDYHKYRDIFFNAVTVGAPPEKVFALGQEWGFPALHPEKIRESGYLYVRRTLQNHFRYCKILRIDHVMGLHRVYGVPKGRSPQEGVYLRFKPEELFAVAMLEAHLHGADLVGENLGTVPAAVNALLRKRKFKGMWVFQEKIQKAGAKIPDDEMASLNTHDMPMFQQFLSGNDLDEVRNLGILNEKFVAPFRAERKEGVLRWAKMLRMKHFSEGAFFRRVLGFLAGSRARYLVFNLEDAWGETRPQNIPGTYREVPNWRRKFALAVEDWVRTPVVCAAFEILRQKRGKKR